MAQHLRESCVEGGLSANQGQSRLLQYEPSHNRISLGTENESLSYNVGQTSKLEQLSSI